VLSDAFPLFLLVSVRLETGAIRQFPVIRTVTLDAHAETQFPHIRGNDHWVHTDNYLLARRGIALCAKMVNLDSTGR
jgi:hypothetical protein